MKGGTDLLVQFYIQNISAGVMETLLKDSATIINGECAGFARNSTRLISGIRVPRIWV